MTKFTDSRTRVEGYDAETRILVVDGDEDFAKFFKIHLNKYFSKVFVTGNPKEALTWFETNPFDLVISEVNLPRLDGFGLVKKIRKLDKKVPVILMTALNHTSVQREKMEECDGFLNKPFTMKEFHNCLKHGLDKKVGKPSSFIDEEALAEEDA